MYAGGRAACSGTPADAVYEAPASLRTAGALRDPDVSPVNVYSSSSAAAYAAVAAAAAAAAHGYVMPFNVDSVAFCSSLQVTYV